MEYEIKRSTNNESNIIFYFMLSIAIIGSMTIILLNIFRWTLVDIFTPFFAPFIEIIGYFIFIVCSLIIFIYYVASRKNRRARNKIPILLNVGVLVLVLVIPITSITLNLDFRYHKSERDEVVQLVLNGSLNPNVSHNESLILLPNEYKKLSKGGGEIVVEGTGQGTHILFYTYRGVIDNYAGFIYTVDGRRPDAVRFGDFIEVKKLNRYWYWVSAT
jgi:hypothetical protein